jgi:hypothetical protein
MACRWGSRSLDRIEFSRGGWQEAACLTYSISLRYMTNLSGHPSYGRGLVSTVAIMHHTPAPRMGHEMLESREAGRQWSSRMPEAYVLVGELEQSSPGLLHLKRAVTNIATLCYICEALSRRRQEYCSETFSLHYCAIRLGICKE